MQRLAFAFIALALLVPAPAAAKAPLSRADRRAITATLDRFVPTAVARSHVAASYDLVTPALRQGMTRAQWAKGDIPVYPFAARPGHFDGWTLDYATRNEVQLDLLVPPRHPKREGPIGFTIGMKRIAGRWLVDSVIPAAIFPKEGSTGGGNLHAANDFSAPQQQSGGSSGDQPRLRAAWALVPALLVVAIVGVPLAIFGVNWRRDRRARRAYGR